MSLSLTVVALKPFWAGGEMIHEGEALECSNRNDARYLIGSGNARPALAADLDDDAEPEATPTDDASKDAGATVDDAPADADGDNPPGTGNTTGKKKK